MKSSKKNGRVSFCSSLCLLIFTMSSYAITEREKVELTSSDKITINCILSAEKSQQLSNGVWLSFAIYSNKTIKLLPWLTPLEGLMADLFTITDSSGRELVYQGPKIKRATPTDNDYVLLKANERNTNTLELSLAYEFEILQNYQIDLRHNLFNILDTEQKQHFVPCLLNEKVVIQVN